MFKVRRHAPEDNPPHKFITILVTAQKSIGKGSLPYMQVPRIGEWVELEEDGKAIMCEVIMVAHSTTGGSSDVFLRRLGDADEVREGLRLSGAAQ